MRSRLIATSTALLILGAAGLLAGCGDTQSALDSADTAAGKTLFTKSCAGCHTLQDARSTGTIGPDLDDAFRGAREQGFKETQFYGVVHRWIQEAPQPPAPGSYPVAMPQDLVVGADAESVAAYVAKVAGKSPDSEVTAITPAVKGPAMPADGGATNP